MPRPPIFYLYTFFFKYVLYFKYEKSHILEFKSLVHTLRVSSTEYLAWKT